MPLFARPGSTGPDASEPTGLRLFGAAAITVVRLSFVDHTVWQFAGHAVVQRWFAGDVDRSLRAEQPSRMNQWLRRREQGRDVHAYHRLCPFRHSERSGAGGVSPALAASCTADPDVRHWTVAGDAGCDTDISGAARKRTG